MTTPVKFRDVGTLSMIARNVMLVPLVGEAPDSPGAAATAETREHAKLMLEMVCMAFIEPVVSMNPKDETELRPEDLPAQTQRFMVDFIYGRIDADGNRIDAFRQNAGVPAPSPNSGAVSPVAE